MYYSWWLDLMIEIAFPEIFSTGANYLNFKYTSCSVDSKLEIPIQLSKIDFLWTLLWSKDYL